MVKNSHEKKSHCHNTMNYTNILIEGPDGAGKSTAVERIKNVLHWDAKSLHHQEGDQFLRYLREYALAEKIVFDRGHFSEEVYSCLWRGGSPFSPEEKQILDQLCKTRFLVIFLNPGIEIIKQRYRQRIFHQQIKNEELQQSVDLFQQVMENHFYLFSALQNYADLEHLVQQVRGLVA